MAGEAGEALRVPVRVVVDLVACSSADCRQGEGGAPDLVVVGLCPLSRVALLQAVFSALQRTSGWRLDVEVGADAPEVLRWVRRRSRCPAVRGRIALRCWPTSDGVPSGGAGADGRGRKCRAGRPAPAR